MNQVSLCNEFLLVVANRSFSKAAKQLNIRPSLLSKHISQLEISVNVKLLNRNLKKITLTEAGEFFFVQATQFVSTWETTINQLHSETKSPHGRLRIGIPEFLQELYQQELLSSYQYLSKY
jgi:DNA-binding transcriptional LysR family regulator